MAATITEGVLWELQADASKLVAAYREATAASDRAGASAMKAARASTAAFAGLTKQAESAGTQVARAGSEIGKASGEIDRSAASSVRAGAALARLSADAAQGYVSVRALTSVVVNMPTALGVVSGGVLGLAAALGVLTLAGAKAQNSLAGIGDQAKQTGIGANTLRGAELLGARVGLSGEDSRGALANAAKQFEQFKRNAGEVKDNIEKVDEKFLGVLDKTRTFGEFFDAVLQKIRALPQEEGLDLAKKLLGEDAGQRLFASIQGGAISMKSLGDEAERAGTKLNDEVVARAEAMQKKIDEAAEAASGKLLVAFQNLGDPVANLKLQWFEFVGGIGDAIAKSKELQLIMQGFFHPVDAVKGLFGGQSGAVAPAASAPSIGRLITLRPDEYSRPENDALLRTPAGVPRARYEAREDKDKGGAAKVTDAERAEKRYEEITRNLSNQLDLLKAQGEEHDRLELKIRVENEQHKIGVGATEAQKKNVADLVTQIDNAEKAQKRLNEEARAFNQAYGEIGHTVSDGLKGLIKGDKPKDLLRSGLERLSGGLLDAGLTGSGPFAKFLGLEGKDGAVGGLFGLAADALGFGGGDKTAQTVNVKGSIVNVAGKGGVVDEAGGLFSKLFDSGGGILGGIGRFFGIGGGGAIADGEAAIASGLYADGGPVGTSRSVGLVPSSYFTGARRFATGGAIPIIAHAGEVVLNAAQQRNVAAAIKGPAIATPFAKRPAAWRAESAAPTIINFNVTSPDAPSFARSESQMSALLTRAIARGQRNI